MSGTNFAALRERLRRGEPLVQVVAAPQLFPTPPAVVRRMLDLAEISPGMAVLEPSAGTGNIVSALEATGAHVTAYEIEPRLAHAGRFTCADFLSVIPAPSFDRVLMNPPFERGADIIHIHHALNFLNKNGKLVAICANGPRQQEALRPLARLWEPLPPGTFEGTGVHAALLLVEGRGAENGGRRGRKSTEETPWTPTSRWPSSNLVD